MCDRVGIMDHGKVIALGTPRELIASIGAEHVVEFNVSGAAPAESALRALPGVRDVRTRGEAVALATSELHFTVPALLAYFSEVNLTLSLLSTHSATLEDVFVSLTGRQLREVDRGGASHPLVELTVARFREFLREPEAASSGSSPSP